MSSNLRTIGNKIYLYDTPIVTILSDKTVTLNSGGYKTATTKRYINKYLRDTNSNFVVFQKNFTWFLENQKTGNKVEFSDHMIVRIG